jgi:drug/metabolite transporter (DMT)-like permease
MDTSPQHLRAILYALLGFSLWVLVDASIKLMGEASLPPSEIVGFLGFFCATFAAAGHMARGGHVRGLWPVRIGKQTIRALLVFGCVMANAVALKHLPLTLFYITVFTAPMVIAIMASLFLRERLTWQKIAAVIAGFIGVVVAIAPWDSSSGGDWIGYAAASAGVLFFSLATVWLRTMAQTESVRSLVFFTGLVEAMSGFAVMAWSGAPVIWPLLPMLALAGAFNVVGNVYNYMSLQLTAAATVEQFHYTQIIFGALIGYIVWHEVPSQHMIFGAAIIIVSGLYVAHSHRTAKAAVLPQT